jgi:uncharacterized membrane protein YkvA (DUF1232 family)
MGIWWFFQKWVGLVKEPLVVLFAMLDPRVAARSKVAAAVSVLLLILYVINPLDIIPDFLPFGFIDDLAVIPLATYFIERMLPGDIVRESRLKASARLRSFTLALDIIAGFLLLAALIVVTSIAYGIFILVQRFK